MPLPYSIHRFWCDRCSHVPKAPEIEKATDNGGFFNSGRLHATNVASSPLLTLCAASFDRMPLR
jgi:hypothetical protein